MEVTVKLTGTNLFGGQEVIYTSSSNLYNVNKLDWFNAHSEYYAISVESEIVYRN